MGLRGGDRLLTCNNTCDGLHPTTFSGHMPMYEASASKIEPALRVGGTTANDRSGRANFRLFVRCKVWNSLGKVKTFPHIIRPLHALV